MTGIRCKYVGSKIATKKKKLVATGPLCLHCMLIPKCESSESIKTTAGPGRICAFLTFFFEKTEINQKVIVPKMKVKPTGIHISSLNALISPRQRGIVSPDGTNQVNSPLM